MDHAEAYLAPTATVRRVASREAAVRLATRRVDSMIISVERWEKIQGRQMDRVQDPQQKWKKDGRREKKGRRVV